MKYCTLLFFLSFEVNCFDGGGKYEPDFGIGNSCAYLNSVCHLAFQVNNDINLFNACNEIIRLCFILSKEQNERPQIQ